MKILKIKASGLYLTKDTIELDFIANQKVVDGAENVSNIFSNIYTNNVVAITGLNASGKTVSLKIINFALMLMQAQPLNSIDTKDIINNCINNEAIFELTFYNENKVYKLVTKISCLNGVITIIDENLYTANTSSIRSKKALGSDKNYNLITKRSNLDDSYLSEDVSIIIKLIRESETNLYSIHTMNWTTANFHRIHSGIVPQTLIEFLDPTIESLSYIKLENNADEIKLKFNNQDIIYLNSVIQLNNYLSSGTIQGINIFMAVTAILCNGGTLIIDEIENHLNYEIVISLISLFNDKKTNPFGSTLLFTTHYVEILDILDRTDSIYITNNDDKITIDSFNKFLKRNDIKKSDWLKSGIDNKTAPSYSRYIRLKKSIKDFIENRNN